MVCLGYVLTHHVRMTYPGATSLKFPSAFHGWHKQMLQPARLRARRGSHDSSLHSPWARSTWNSVKTEKTEHNRNMEPQR